MFFLTPKYLKQGRLYLKEAHKRLAYNRDRWNAETIADFEKVILELGSAVKAKNKEGIKSAEASLEGLCARHCPLAKDAWIGENVEVFLVAIIVALGIRTYILQPFTIPTSSMYPTLCGVIGTKTEQEPPNFGVQIWQFAAYGRTWHNVVAESDETITAVEEETRSGWRRLLTYTKITAVEDLSPAEARTRNPQRHEYYVNDLKQPIEEAWGQPIEQRDEFGRVMRDTAGNALRTSRSLLVGKRFKKGEPIVRGYTTTGDHVFVDKMSYHFRSPKRGEVFVFTTAGIPGQAERTTGKLRGTPETPSQFFIKRLGAVPGDKLQIKAPQLFINGQLAAEPTFQRVMTGSLAAPNKHYRGYSNMGEQQNPFNNLGTPDATFEVGPNEYFALGDNSYNSADSRDWGVVPEQNLMGNGFLVYWPFLRDEETHFGLIR